MSSARPRWPATTCRSRCSRTPTVVPPAAYRTGGAPTAFLLDPNLRVRATLPLADGARVAADVAELVAELVWDDRRPREITTQAPLLVVPDVLDPEQCAELIAVWEQAGPQRDWRGVRDGRWAH